jgi:thiamine-phosphate pyrophosphorylase
MTPQRAAFLAAQVEAVHRNLRLLEHVVTGPIGLTTDLKSLREAVPSAAAMEDRERQAFQDFPPGRTPREAGIAAQRLINGTLDLIASTALNGSDPLSADWRYRAARVLQRVAERLGADARRDTASSMAGVYVIVDPEHTNGRPVIAVAEAALRGGAAAVQYRDKRSEKGAVLATARQLAAACSKAKAVLIINDHADIAVLAGAGGLHVGQKDIPVREARRVLSPGQVIGKSNALVQEALEAEAEGADYIAVGAIFETATKANTRPAGLETLRQVKRSVAVPVVAIGGINEGNAAQVAEAGADVACVATAVTRADDPESAARRLAEAFQSARKK